MEFKYNIVERKEGICNLTSILNDYGEEGWEIFQVTKITNNADAMDGFIEGQECYQLYMKKQFEPALTGFVA